MKLTKADELLQKILEEYGTADIAPVRHGRWRLSEYAGINYYQCSLCGHSVSPTAYNYCPNCGAKMDGAKDHETD